MAVVLLDELQQVWRVVCMVGSSPCHSHELRQTNATHVVTECNDVWMHISFPSHLAEEVFQGVLIETTLPIKANWQPTHHRLCENYILLCSAVL